MNIFPWYIITAPIKNPCLNSQLKVVKEAIIDRVNIR
jgi:hypothetical protein